MNLHFGGDSSRKKGPQVEMVAEDDQHPKQEEKVTRLDDQATYKPTIGLVMDDPKHGRV